MVLRDLVARTLKNELRARMRNSHKERGAQLSAFGVREQIVAFLNNACGSNTGPRLDVFWHDIREALIDKFGQSALSSDMNYAELRQFAALQPANAAFIAKYVCATTGIQLTPSCTQELTAFGARSANKPAKTLFAFTFVDIADVAARCKYLRYISWHCLCSVINQQCVSSVVNTAAGHFLRRSADTAASTQRGAWLLRAAADEYMLGYAADPSLVSERMRAVLLTAALAEENGQHAEVHFVGIVPSTSVYHFPPGWCQ